MKQWVWHGACEFHPVLKGNIEMATYALGDDIAAAKISSQNVDQMAEILCRRHGRSAFAIANYFALEHEKFGDRQRSEG